MTLTFLGLLAGTLTVPALAETPSPNDPAVAILDEMRAECAARGEALIGPDQVWEPLDLGPEAPDAAMFASLGWGCDETPGFFWHTGGGEVLLRVEGEIYQATAVNLTVIDLFGTRTVILARHGSFCMGAGYQPCFEAVTWSDGRWQTVYGHPPFEAD